jgi:hypothetical protein
MYYDYELWDSLDGHTSDVIDSLLVIADILLVNM